MSGANKITKALPLALRFHEHANTAFKSKWQFLGLNPAIDYRDGPASDALIATDTSKASPRSRTFRRSAGQLDESAKSPVSRATPR